MTKKLLEKIKKYKMKIICKDFKKYIINVLIIFTSIIVFVLGFICIKGCIESFFDEYNTLFTTKILTSVDISLSNIDRYESLFSPIAAFFAGVASLFTAIILYKQISMEKLQKEESIKTIFHEQLNMMITMRTDITNSIVFIKQNNKEIGKYALNLLVDEIYNIKIKNEQDFCDNKIREKLSPNIIETLYNICKIKDEGIKYNDKDIENIVVSINKYIDCLTRGTLSPFFHNIYTTLKMIYDNNYLTIEDKNNYIRMFRSHFSQQEFVILYYHAFLFKDFGEMKFKKLIEDTCFFHSLIHDYIPIKIEICDDDNGEISFGYSYKAFFHSKSEYEEYKNHLIEKTT